MKVLFESMRCPKCKGQAVRDYQTGPETWFWCEKCREYTTLKYGRIRDEKMPRQTKPAVRRVGS